MRIPLDYPVNPRVRFGHGRPAHPQLAARLAEEGEAVDRVFGAVEAIRELLAEIPDELPKDAPLGPFWEQVWLPRQDAVLLGAQLFLQRPRRVLEIGSGVSTRFLDFFRRRLGLEFELYSIDPRPRVEVDSICDRLDRRAFEDVDLSELELGPEDLVFFDGSHRSFQNSDATVFFLEFLPRLEPGVLVGIHDIFLPWDYPPEFRRRFYNEQYLLAALLLGGFEGWAVEFPAFAVATSTAGPGRWAQLQGRGLADSPGTSFWMRRVSKKANSAR